MSNDDRKFRVNAPLIPEPFLPQPTFEPPPPARPISTEDIVSGTVTTTPWPRDAK